MMPAWGARTSDAAPVLERDVPGRLGRVRVRVEALRLLLRPVQLLRGHQLLVGQLLAALQVGLGPVRVGRASACRWPRPARPRAGSARGRCAASTVCGPTRAPSWKWTAVTAPSTSAVTCTTSSASRQPDAPGSCRSRRARRRAPHGRSAPGRPRPRPLPGSSSSRPPRRRRRERHRGPGKCRVSRVATSSAPPQAGPTNEYCAALRPPFQVTSPPRLQNFVRHGPGVHGPRIGLR